MRAVRHAPGRALRCWSFGALLLVAPCVLAQDDNPFGSPQPARAGQLVWVDDQRLTLPPWAPETPVPNAFDTYQDAVALTGSMGEDVSALVEWVDAALGGDAETVARGLPAVRALVARGEAGLDKLHEAADQVYLDPGGRTFETLLPWLAQFREMARFGRLAAVLACVDGDFALAFRRTEDVFALAINCPRGGTLIDLLVGQAILRIVEDVDLFLILEANAPVEDLARHARRLAELRVRFPPFADTLLVEGGSLVRTLRGMTAEELAEDLALADVDMGTEPDLEAYATERLPEAIEWIEDRYARIALATRDPWGGGEARAVIRRANGDAAGSSDPVIGVCVPALLKPYERHLFAYGCLAGAEATAAVEAYRREKGALPENLEALCPEYLDSVPTDPCSGAPLLYRLTETGYTIYSVGMNGADDGGIGVPPRRDIASADIVFAPLD